MTLKQAIEKAIKGEWRKDKEWEIRSGADDLYVIDKVGTEMIYFSQMLLDPSFWQSLGKDEDLDWGPVLSRWHFDDFHDHIWDGGNIESYFEKL